MMELQVFKQTFKATTQKMVLFTTQLPSGSVPLRVLKGEGVLNVWYLASDNTLKVDYHFVVATKGASFKVGNKTFLNECWMYRKWWFSWWTL